MKIFHCDHCGQPICFENVECLRCKRRLAYLPDQADLASLEEAGEGHWRSRLPRCRKRTYRLCKNYCQENVCNWAIPAAEPNPFCISCRLTRVIPSLGTPGSRSAWYHLEVAKRRMLYTVLALGLPLRSKAEDPQDGLAFEFLADCGQPVLTGHADGVITVNVAEADDLEREKRRLQLHEPYRTLLGHFRHEIGHYYWQLLIRRRGRLDEFRAKFGDEQEDYPAALRRHYEQGPAPDWQQRYISAYASVHPWEDWAESWAHYLHIVDTLETAAACGMSLQAQRPDQRSMKPFPPLVAGRPAPFDHLIEGWMAVTFVLNNLSRGLGLPDAYPFILTTAVLDKLRFVHDTIAQPDTVSPRQSDSPWPSSNIHPPSWSHESAC